MEPENKPKSSGRSCLLYGCLSLIVLVVVAILGFYLTVRYMFNKAIENYTDDAPLEIEMVELTTEEQAALDERIASFEQARQADDTATELSLSGEELNSLIQSHTGENNPFNPRLRVDIVDDRVNARASVDMSPFAELPLIGGLFLSRLEDRYFNADVELNFLLQNGNAVAQLLSGTVNGNELPPEFIEAIEKEGVFKEILNEPEVRKNFENLDWIRIEDGQLKIGREPASE